MEIRKSSAPAPEPPVFLIDAAALHMDDSFLAKGTGKREAGNEGEIPVNGTVTWHEISLSLASGPSLRVAPIFMLEACGPGKMNASGSCQFALRHVPLEVQDIHPAIDILILLHEPERGRHAALKFLT